MRAPFTVTISPQTNEHLAVLVEAMHRLMPPSSEMAPTAENKTKKSKTLATESAAPIPAGDRNENIQGDSAAVFDLVAVRARLAELSKAGKADQVKALITEMGAAKLTDIAPERYAELMEKAGAV